ncbi:MAG: DUF6326 family protein [Coriobacteriia bacterium]|nr:DUF6326 family protein [Coriobacteriia bacterium]
MNDTGTRISTLWIVVMLNMAFADIVGFIQPGALEGVAGPGGVQITQGLLLVFALLIEIPLAMIFMSRILKRAANRWVNTVAAVITSVFVVGGGSMELPFYAFFAAVEVACMALIVLFVWRQRSPEAASLQPVG